jgi:hypothetical protein
MDKDTLKLIFQLAELLGVKHTANDCGCHSCCDCTTTRTFEQSAARFNEQQAFASVESSKSFLQQQSAQFSQLLKLQADVTNKPTT